MSARVLVQQILCVDRVLVNHCGCALQEKPVPPPCGTTTPGCTSTTTPPGESLLSLSRTSSMPCSLTPASSSCSETRWKGGRTFHLTACLLSRLCCFTAQTEAFSSSWMTTFVLWLFTKSRCQKIFLMMVFLVVSGFCFLL